MASKNGDIDIYRRLRQIGEGTYGRVYLCEERDGVDGARKQVAIKKVQIAAGKEGFPQTAVREIKLLALLRHENIVRLERIVTPPKADKEAGDTIFMVFEYLDHDLAGLIRDPRVNLSPYQIKWFVKQLVEGLKHCHDQRVLHRDIKASNILVDNYGNLKLADFGLARSYSETCSDTKYSNKVITLWYRPPELLLGSETYGPAVDMWSVGCILAEMIQGRPLFCGQNHIDQLEVIFKLCGTPTHVNWPAHADLPWYKMFKPQHMIDRSLREHLESASADSAHETNEHAIDLLDKLLVLDPNSRVSAAKMLEHEYFWTEPLPQRQKNPDALLPENVSCHEYETKLEAKREGRPTSRPRGADGGKAGADGKRRGDAPTSPQMGDKKRRSSGGAAGGPRLDEHGELIRDSGFASSVGKERRSSTAGGAEAAYDPLAR